MIENLLTEYDILTSCGKYRVWNIPEIQEAVHQAVLYNGTNVKTSKCPPQKRITTFLKKYHQIMSSWHPNKDNKEIAIDIYQKMFTILSQYDSIGDPIVNQMITVPWREKLKKYAEKYKLNEEEIKKSQPPPLKDLKIIV